MIKPLIYYIQESLINKNSKINQKVNLGFIKDSDKIIREIYNLLYQICTEKRYSEIKEVDDWYELIIYIDKIFDKPIYDIELLDCFFNDKDGEGEIYVKYNSSSYYREINEKDFKKYFNINQLNQIYQYLFTDILDK